MNLARNLERSAQMDTQAGLVAAGLTRLGIGPKSWKPEGEMERCERQGKGGFNPRMMQNAFP